MAIKTRREYAILTSDFAWYWRPLNETSHDPDGRARHSVRAAAWQWANGAQGTDAPYRAGWSMARMRDFEIVEASDIGLFVRERDIHKILQQLQPDFLALLGMELRGIDIVAPNG